MFGQVGVTVPGDNSIDVLTNDVAVVVISNDAGEVEVNISTCFTALT